MRMKVHDLKVWDGLGFHKIKPISFLQGVCVPYSTPESLISKQRKWWKHFPVDKANLFIIGLYLFCDSVLKFPVLEYF